MQAIFIGSSIEETKAAMEAMLRGSNAPLEIVSTESLQASGQATTVVVCEPWRGKASA